MLTANQHFWSDGHEAHRFSRALIPLLLILSFLRAKEEPHRAIISSHHQPPDMFFNKALD